MNVIKTPAVEWHQLKSLSPNLTSKKEFRGKDQPNDHLPPSKNGHPIPPKRERDTNLGSRLEGKRSKEGRKTYLLSLTERRGKGP